MAKTEIAFYDKEQVDALIPDVSDFVKEDELAPVALSGSYDDLLNKPVIPSGVQLYPSTGQNTDGAMTQKAVTDALNTKLTALTHEIQWQRSQTGTDMDKYILLVDTYVYDTCVAIEIWETSSMTNHILLEIATQNKRVKVASAFSDFNGDFAGRFYYNTPSPTDPYLRVYYRPNAYTKIGCNMKILYPGGNIREYNAQLTTTMPEDATNTFNDRLTLSMANKQDKLNVTLVNNSYYQVTY